MERGDGVTALITTPDVCISAEYTTRPGFPARVCICFPGRIAGRTLPRQADPWRLWLRSGIGCRSIRRFPRTQAKVSHSARKVFRRARTEGWPSLGARLTIGNDVMRSDVSMLGSGRKPLAILLQGDPQSGAMNKSNMERPSSRKPDCRRIRTVHLRPTRHHGQPADPCPIARPPSQQRAPLSTRTNPTRQQHEFRDERRRRSACKTRGKGQDAARDQASPSSRHAARSQQTGSSSRSDTDSRTGIQRFSRSSGRTVKAPALQPISASERSSTPLPPHGGKGVVLRCMFMCSHCRKPVATCAKLGRHHARCLEGCSGAGRRKSSGIGAGASNGTIAGAAGPRMHALPVRRSGR